MGLHGFQFGGNEMEKGVFPQLVAGASTLRIAILLAVSILPAIAVIVSASASPLQDAISEGDVKGVREALKAGADPNAALEGTGLSAISMAANIPLFLHDGKESEKTALEILKLLFEAGASIGAKDSTILHCASKKGDRAILEFLISKGADLNAVDGEGNSPLSLAIEYEHPEIVEALLRHGAQPIAESEITQIRFVSAAKKGNTSKMSEFLSKGAEINGKTPYGETALVAAASAQQEKSVEWLLRKGADANLYAREGSVEAPPLWHAMLCHRSLFNITVPLLLLRQGALASATDTHLKRTPLHIAARLDNLLAVAMLLNAGADVNARDAEGKTPLDYSEDDRIIKALKTAGAVEH
jgi:ankyrin repeat protein